MSKRNEVLKLFNGKFWVKTEITDWDELRLEEGA